MIPRIRGKVGQVAEGPPEMIGKWYFHLIITELGAGDEDEGSDYGPFETETEAKQALEHACKIVCEQFERLDTGYFSGEYIDMKDNKRKKWKP